MNILFIINNLGVNEPFGPMILSAVLKEKGHETALGVIQKEDVAAKINQFKPNILAYSMMSVDMHDFKIFNDKIKKQTGLFKILGGPHATLNPDCINDHNIDAVCIGEGEGALVDVIKAIQNKHGIAGIPNIVTKTKRDYTIRPLIEDFSKYPHMDRELVYAYSEMRKFGIKGYGPAAAAYFPAHTVLTTGRMSFLKDTAGWCAEEQLMM